MKVEFRDSFQRDLAKSRDGVLAKQIHKLIMKLESAKSLTDIPNVKKLVGSTNFFRIRVGDYRVGLIFQSGTVVLVRVLNRKEIYRYFP